MKGLLVLAVGMGFLLSSFVWAVIRSKTVSLAAHTRRWLPLTYTFLTGASLVLSGLLCLSIQLEHLVSVDSYVYLFDVMSGVLLAATVCGIVVLLKNRRWLLNFLCFLIGAMVVFVEFLGR